MVWRWRTIPPQCRMGRWNDFLHEFTNCAYKFSLQTLLLIHIPAQTVNHKSPNFSTCLWAANLQQWTHASANHQQQCAREHLHANEQTTHAFKQLQDPQPINTHSLCLTLSCPPPRSHIWRMQTEHLFMHLCIQAVRHVGFDCAQGSWAVLQCRCKTFVSRGYLQCSQAECGEPSVCLFQGEIGDRSCLLGMLLVMRSQETLPSSSVFLFSSFLSVQSRLLFVSLLPLLLPFFSPVVLCMFYFPLSSSYHL